jgi:tripartite-type tricarboxylate transporter receptor subunit TctC
MRGFSMKRPLLAALAAAALAPALVCAAGDFPLRPIRLIVPFPPGGGADTLARIVGQKMGEAWGQQVVIDNRPGGATNIAAELAAHALPDGHTLLETVLAHAVNPSLFPRLSYDIHRDFAPVVFMATVPNILVVHPSVQVKSTRELIDYVRARPGQLNYASTGNGGPQHLGMELLKTLTSMQLTHVPYKGAAPAHADIVSGQIQVMMINMLSGLPLIRASRLRALAISSARRSPVLPALPTIAESGAPGFESGSWFGISVPAKTPRAIVDKLNDEANRILKNPELRERLAGEGADFVGGTAEAYGSFMRAESTKWAKVVKFARIKLD